MEGRGGGGGYPRKQERKVRRIKQEKSFKRGLLFELVIAVGKWHSILLKTV